MSNFIFKYKTTDGNPVTDNGWINEHKIGDQYQEDGWWCVEYSGTGIGDGAFYGANFTEVDTGDGISNLGEEYSVFANCNYLEKVYVGKNVYIDCNSLFESAPKVEVVVVDEGNEYFDSRDNCNAIIETENNRLVTGCKTTFIPEKVEMIAMDSFYGIDLTTLTCLPTTPPELGEYSFGYNWSSEGKTLYVPKESVSAYQVSDWVNYFANIVQIPDPEPPVPPTPHFGFNLSGMRDTDYVRQY